MKVKSLFPDGPAVGVLGFGASVLGNVFGEVSSGEGNDAVAAAIDQGINFFDTSPYYGQTLSEERLGVALLGRRQKIVLATKCGRYGVDHFDFSGATVTARFEDSLKRLQTDYVDLLQVHDCEFGTVDQIVEETLPALLALQAAGKARFLGITGYIPENLQEVATRAQRRGIAIQTVLSYCRYNLANQSLDEHLAPYCDRASLGLVNASPLHMGLLTQAGPPPWHPAAEAAKDAAKTAVAFCHQHGTTLEQVALRFCLEYSYASTTLVGMATKQVVRANLDTMAEPFDAVLTREVIEILEANGAGAIWESGLKINNPSSTKGTK